MHLLITSQISASKHHRVGRALDLDINVHGAPNFRAPRHGDLNVFGVAQPRTQGLRAILSVLRCRPNTPNPSHVVWFSTREEPVGMSQISPISLLHRGIQGNRKSMRMGDPFSAVEGYNRYLTTSSYKCSSL